MKTQSSAVTSHPSDRDISETIQVWLLSARYPRPQCMLFIVVHKSLCGHKNTDATVASRSSQIIEFADSCNMHHETLSRPD